MGRKTTEVDARDFGWEGGSTDGSVFVARLVTLRHVSTKAVNRTRRGN